MDEEIHRWTRVTDPTAEYIIREKEWNPPEEWMRNLDPIEYCEFTNSPFYHPRRRTSNPQ